MCNCKLYVVHICYRHLKANEGIITFVLYIRIFIVYTVHVHVLLFYNTCTCRCHSAHCIAEIQGKFPFCKLSRRNLCSCVVKYIFVLHMNIVYVNILLCIFRKIKTRLQYSKILKMCVMCPDSTTITSSYHTYCNGKNISCKSNMV